MNQPDIDRLRPRAFAFRCARWMAAAFVLIALVWLLGFEVIPYRATPLDTTPSNALDDIRLLPTMIVLILGAALLLRRAVIAPEIPLPRALLITWMGGMLAIIAAWVLPWTPPPPSLSHHVLAVAVFVTGVGGLLSAAIAMGMPRREPSPAQARLMLLGITVFAFLFAGSIAMLRGGPDAFRLQGASASPGLYSDIDKVGSWNSLFRDYNAMHPVLATETRTHPPGALLFAWTLAGAAGTAPLALALVSMLLAALAVIPLYAWVAAMTAPRTGLYAALLYAVIPGVAIYMPGAIEAAFAPLTLACLACFAWALPEGRARYALAAGGLFAVLSLIHFALLGLSAWFLIAACLRATRPQASAPILKTLAVFLAAFLGVHAGVSALTGFDYAECFQLAWRAMQAAHPTRVLPYAWPVFNLLALLICVGIPVCLLAIETDSGEDPAPAHAPMALASLIAFAFVAVSYPGVGGIEHIAFHAYPFAVFPAAVTLDHAARRQASLALPAVVLALCALQTWYLRVYFDAS